MSKVLHIFVFIFLILTGVALWFEIQLHGKRTELKDRNRMQEEFIVDISRMIETGGDDDISEKVECQKDDSPVEDRIVDEPNYENLLDEYPYYLEKLDHKYFTWGEAEREKLREVYVMEEDASGVRVPMKDGAEFMTRDSEEDKLLKTLKNAIEAQKDRLAKTREALPVLRKHLSSVVNELNSLKGEARKDKVTIKEKDEKIGKLDKEKSDLQNEIVKTKSQIDELNAEISSLKDEVVSIRDEAELAKEELAKEKENSERLKEMLAKLASNTTTGPATFAGSQAASTVPAGDKGRIIEADNENMFAIVKLSDAAMKELKGEDLSRPLPLVEFSVRREGFEGPNGDLVGRLRTKQEYPGVNIITCEILSSWSITDMAYEDIVYSAD